MQLESPFVSVCTPERRRQPAPACSWPLTGGGIISPTLDVPTPFAAADVIEREPGGGDRVAFHYAIVEVAARVEDPSATPVAAGDVDDARWVPVDQLDSFPGLARALHFITCVLVPPASVAMLAAMSWLLHCRHALKCCVQAACAGCMCPSFVYAWLQCGCI